MSTVALGFKPHSGWAAMVALDGSLKVLERRRIDLVAPEDSHWAKQPYHAAEDLDAHAARQLIARGIDAAQRMCLHQMRANCERFGDAGRVIAGCGIVGSDNMPDWTVEQILAVHMRMHKAEGVLFPAALKQAACACALKVCVTSEADLNVRAAQNTDFGSAARDILAQGKSLGPPWGKDQKSAALAALIVLLG